MHAMKKRIKPPWQRRLGLGKGPVEPVRQRLDVLGLDGGAAPDAQAGRRVAIMRDVEGRAFLLDQRDQLLGEVGLRVRRQRGDRGIDHLQAHRGVGADRGILRPGSRPTASSPPSRSSTLVLASARAISAFRPPIDFAQFSASR